MRYDAVRKAWLCPKAECSARVAGTRVVPDPEGTSDGRLGDLVLPRVNVVRVDFAGLRERVAQLERRHGIYAW